MELDIHRDAITQSSRLKCVILEIDRYVLFDRLVDVAAIDGQWNVLAEIFGHYWHTYSLALRL